VLRLAHIRQAVRFGHENRARAKLTIPSNLLQYG
jgi:hypothetical protein